jgi:predicted permease
LVYAYAKIGSEERLMAFYAFYVIAIIILILHFTGWLKRNNLEWLVLVLAVATFPAVIFLK